MAATGARATKSNRMPLAIWGPLGCAIAIFVTVLAFNLLGDGLRDALDPKIERR